MSTAIQILVLGALSSGIACANPFGDDDLVRLYINELQVPATVATFGPLDAVAVVSTGGCLSFRRLDMRRHGSLVQLTAIGRDRGGPGISCPADIRFEPKVFRVAGPFADSLLVTARQPDDAILRRVIIVE